jgi:hypothetical protein
VKLKLTIELDYNAELYHQDDPDAIEWFFRDILIEDLLMLYSNCIGDMIGTVKVLEIQKEENSDTTN